MDEDPCFRVKDTSRVVAGIGHLRIRKTKKRLEGDELALRKKVEVTSKRQAELGLDAVRDRECREILYQPFVEPCRNFGLPEIRIHDRVNVLVKDDAKGLLVLALGR